MFKEDLYEINNEIDKINQRIDSLCNAVNTNIASLQTIIDVMQDNDYVDSITPIVEGGETVGYEIVFTQSGSVKIYHGKKGETGATGHTPVIGVKQAEDGRWYWTVDGAYLLDGEGDKILAEAIDGEDGATGADGITPQLKVEGDYWYISYDNKATWERLGKATGEAGKDGDSMFQSVNYNDEYVELVLIDGTVLRIPTWASHMLLVDEIAKINSNISAIQAAIEALESNDYVQKVTPVKDEDGNVIGYTLQFAFTGDVTIYHGEDGKDGEDGEDGKDGADGEDGKDGYTPVIGARQHPDGNWYWTVDTEWLLDTNGNKVKTTGEDGTSGITPELKIQDDYWYVSYDKGQTWTKLGKAKGEDGAAGSAGTAGDAFFKGVDTSDEYYVKFTLADGTVIKIPTWKAYQELADLVDQLNTNFKSLNDIVVGIQNNDYITGYTPIVDPQTNEEIGYTLHFAKSGDITIYHGKTGQDGVAPDISIQEHPKYGLCWTYNGEFIIDPGTGKPVALPSDGKNGKDGVSPKLKIEDGEWWVSYNNGSSWTSLGQATGDTGATGGTGDSFFKSIEPEYAKDANGNVLKDEFGRPIVAYIVMTLAGENEGDEVTYKVPTEYVTSELNKRLAAIEAQFSTISTIVNALQNAEYIKEVVELYEGPALVGYEITFVKYTIGTDGKLTETTRKSTIRNGGAGAAGTVVAAQYDEATDTWYWTLDGQPLKDKDGNYVAINGRPGQAGVTPKMQINKDTNEWEVSYDNGTTWTSTGVKATGPQGPQGNPGQGGAAGDSFFAGVSKDGDYWVFELVSGEKIMVPTAEAFASLAGRVAALEKSAESILSLVNGKKYIESCEPFSNDSGSGYHLVLVSLNAETGEATKEDCYIYNGIAGNTPVVGLRQDEATGDWYWTVDGEDLLVDGKPVKANGPEPSFHIDQNGHLWVNVNGNEKDLGNVIGAGGGSGADASILVEEVKDDAGKPTGELIITFMSGTSETGKISVPSWAKFVELQNAVNELNTYVTALQTAVKALEDNDYVTAITDLKDEEGNVIGYTLTFAKSGEKVIYHGKKGDKGDDAIAPKVRINEETNEWEISTDGGESWTSTDVVAVGPKGEDGVTPKFKIENGQWYVSYDNGTTWGDPLGQATGSTGATGSSGASFFESVSEEKDAEGNITHIVIVVPDETPEDYSDNTKYRIPTAFTYAKLEKQINEANSNIEALQAAVAALEKNDYVKEVIDIVEDDVVVGYKLIFAISGEKSIYHGKKGDKGDDAIAPKIRINENTKEWEISTDDGESWTSTGVVAVGPKGEDGATPKFKIENGEWYVSFDNGTSWSESLGQATGDKGETGSTGTSGASFFESVTDEKDSEGNVTYIVITVPDDNDDPTDNVQYRIPTAFTIGKLEAQVSQLNSNVAALQTAVAALENNDYVTAIEDVKDDAGNVIGYKLTFAKSGEKTIYHGAKGDKGEDAVAPRVQINAESNEWEISTDGGETWTSTGVSAVGPKGDAGATPKFKIENGEWYVSYDNGTTWSESLGQATGDKGETGSAGSDGDAFFDAVNEMTYDADGNIVAAGEGDTVYFIEIVLTDGDDDDDNNKSYLIPTKAETDRIATVLEELTSDYIALKNALNNTMFITGMEAITPTETDSRGGYKLFYKTFKDGSMTDSTEPLYVYDGITPNAPVLGVGSVEVEGVTKYYWTVNGVALDADPTTDVVEYVYTTGENGKTPELGFSVVDGNLIITVDGTEVLKAAVKGDQGTSGLEIVPNEDGTTVSIYYDKNGDGKIDKSDESTELLTTVPKWFNEPSVTFTEGVTNDKVTGATTVKFKVTGSFVGKPEVYAACEGNWSSSVVTVGDLNDEKTEVICSVTVSPTTAYVGDSTLGKLTIYVPYYGKTTIKQVELSAAGTTGLEMQSMPILPKDAEDTKATISFTLDEGDNTPSSNGSCTLVYDFGYTLTDIQTTTEGKEVETGNGFSGSFGGGDWLSTGAYKYDPTTKKITQEIDIQPYIDLKATSPRVAAVIVYSPSGREVSRFIIKQDKVNVINLAENESANCYIISEPGYYKFPVVKGNTNTRVVNGDDLTKDIFDDTHINGGNNPIDILAYDDNYVYFKVDAESINPGNSLITVKDGNNIAWSWHLWFNAPANRADDPNILDTYPNNKGTVMNRSLGAISPDLDYQVLGYDLSYWKDGLYYQWGRKDPLVLSTQSDVQVIPTDRIISGNNYSLSIQNPSKLIDDWSAPNGGWTDKNNKNAKQVDDPCPPGYKVPSQSLWTESDESDLLSLESIFGTFESVYPYNLALSTEMNQNIVFPYSGEVSLSNAQDNVGIVMANSADATVTYESEPEKDIYLGIEVLGYSLYSDKVKNLVVEVDIHSLYGLTWSNSPSALKYEYGKLNIDISEILTNFNKFRDIINIKSCEVCHNNYEITYKWGIIPTGVKDHWETTYKPYPGTATLTDNDKGFILYELLKEGVLVNLKHKIIEDLPKSNALHVRCVQD